MICKSSSRCILLLLVLCSSRGFAAEPEKKVPFEGDEVTLVDIKANSKNFVGKQFVICGGIHIDDFFNWEYDNAVHTHNSIRFRQVGKDSRLTREDAHLYLLRKGGAPIIEKLVAAEKNNPGVGFFLVRARVAILPDRYDPDAWNYFELLDIQFITKNWKGWQKGVLAQIEEEKQRKLAEQREWGRERKREIEIRKQREREALVPKFRVWKDKTEKYQRTAKFRAVINKKVKLELKDGKIIHVAVEALCEADKTYLKERKRLVLKNR